jgi:UDP-N-acetylglucosamine 3-dehydrogenase
MRAIRWGVIGIGRFGAVHARVLSALPGVELAAVCRRDEVLCRRAAAEFCAERAFTDYRQMLASSDIDAVSVTTHWQEHYEIAMAALDSGKHVLLEKPMAATSQQCRALVAAAARARGRFMTAHVCRFDPRVTLAKAAIDQGRIGQVVSMHAKRNLPKAPGSLRLDKISPLMGDGVHDADLMMWFLGTAPLRVYGRHVRVDQFRHPDIGWAMLEFGDQAIGVIETVWRLPENTPTVIDAQMEVIGTEGALAIDCAHTGLTILDANGLKMPDTAYWPKQHGRLVGALAYELEYFANCIRTDRAPDVITAVEAARAVMVIEAAERSAALGQVLEYHDCWAPENPQEPR